MEASFNAVNKALEIQIRGLEVQCNTVINSLKAENRQLRRELVEMRSALFSSRPLGQLNGKSFTPGCTPRMDFDHNGLLGFASPGHNGPASGKHIMPYSSRRPIPAEVAEPLTPPSVVCPRVVSTAYSCGFGGGFEQVDPCSPSRMLCVTPGRFTPAGFKSFDPPRQPIDHVPLEGLLAFDASNSEVRTSIIESLTKSYSRISEREEPENDKINRWATFFVGLMDLQDRPPERKSKVPKQAKHELSLRPFWVVGPNAQMSLQSHGDKRSNSGTRSLRGGTFGRDVVRVGSIIKAKRSCLQPFTVHPEHKFTMLRTLLQGALILFDTIEFPMMVFGTEKSDFANTTMIISMSFWTWDLLFSFLQGFHSFDGVIEMRPGQIARHYMRNWFLFDVVVLSLDWISFAVFILENAGDEQSKLAEASKFSQVARLARGGRILRLAKSIEKFKALVDSTASAEWVVVFAKIFSLILMILLINHYVACAWYGIADGSSDAKTWISVQMIEDLDIFDKYIYSLHWSLTQFTPCTNDIAPANSMERFFASFAVILSLVTFSTFLSTLTNAVMQVKKLNFERYNEEAQIRDFLVAKRIPLSVANRVWIYYRKHYRQRKKILQEADIPFFAALPKSVRRELRTHMNCPILTNHPVVKELVTDKESPLVPLLCESVSSFSPVSGEDIFIEGEVATHMYYFVSGSGTYSFNGKDTTAGAPDYIAEAVLWLTQWNHTGCLTVSNNRCEMLLLDAAVFVECVEKEAEDILIRSLRKYASLYAQHLYDAEADPITKPSQSASFSVFASGSWTSIGFADDGISTFSDLPLEQEVRDQLAAQAFVLKNSNSGMSSFVSEPDNSQISRMHEIGRRFGSLIKRAL